MRFLRNLAVAAAALICTGAAAMFIYEWEERAAARELLAWQILQGPSSGKDGKLAALEYLNSQGVKLNAIEVGPSAHLFGARLPDAVLPYADLQGAIFTTAFLQRANFHGADLRGAWFRMADLTKAHLGSADLTGADFYRANISGAGFDTATVDGTTKFQDAWAYADMPPAGLSKAVLQQIELRAR